MLVDLMRGGSAAKPLPLANWRSGAIGSLPKVNGLPTGTTTLANSYGLRPRKVKAYNGALYLLAFFC